MINATILERRFERRLQTRFDYGYWNVILLLEKVINAPIDILLNMQNFQFCGAQAFVMQIKNVSYFDPSEKWSDAPASIYISIQSIHIFTIML